MFNPPDPAPEPALPSWRDLGLRGVWEAPLPALASPLERLVLRTAVLLARRQVRDITDWTRVRPARDPFILAVNHGSRRETLYLTAALMLARGGRPVHFLADWNFRLIPGVGWLYTHSGAITVTRKDARPRILNHFRSRFLGTTTPLEQARARLAAGASIGLFPEGTVNRDPVRLLRGRHGAARLSLETGVPILPAGIRFEGRGGGDRRSDSGAPIEIRFGTPLVPPPLKDQDPGALPAAATQVRAWHAEVMTVIAGLCGKSWSGAAAPDAPPPAAPRSIAMQHRAIGPGGPS